MDDPTERLSDTPIHPELAASDLVWAGIAAQCLVQLGSERTGADKVGVAHFEQIRERFFQASARGMCEAGLSLEEIEVVMDEVKAEAAIFQMPNS